MPAKTIDAITSLPNPAEFNTAQRPRAFLTGELPVAAGIVAGVAASILWTFILQPKYSAMMLEYVQKFLPALLDNGPIAIFDATGIGDPRPRLLANFLAFVNIKMRGLLLDWGAMHPSASVSWALFPLAVALLYKAVQCMTGSNRSAFMSAALYSVSPSLLDMLVNYYIPAKPLASVLFISSIYGAARVAPHPSTNQEPRPLLGAIIIFCSILCALLSDETAIFSFAILPLLFLNVFHPPRPLRTEAVAIAGSLFAAGCVFALITLWVIPRINLSLGQIPLDFPRLALYGVYKAVFGVEGPSALTRIADYSPLALLAVIISAHAIPLRVVTDIWTRNSPFDGFWQPHEIVSLVFFACLVLFLCSKLTREEKPYVMRLLLAFFAFLLLQSLIILPLASRIVEVNYYAGFSSIFFALLMGQLTSCCEGNANLRLIGWLILLYFLATQFSNFIATAQRHPGFDRTDLSWSLLRETMKRVAAGEFETVAREHPLPSRLFLLGFEYESYRQHAMGHKVDLQPMARPEDTLYGMLNIKAFADPKLLPQPAFIPKNEAEMEELGASLAEAREIFAFLKGRRLTGASGPWNYTREIDGNGNIRERIWYAGLMRAWNDKGALIDNDYEVCMTFVNSGTQCIARLFRLEKIFYGFNKNGELVTHFKLLP